ncbi:MAG: Hint domain-containing protein [Pseudomonadota bacterium]
MSVPAGLRVPHLSVSQPPRYRAYEITALTHDGTITNETIKAPISVLFDSAFSAFARGAMLSTPDGTIAIEDLLPGDMLSTSAGTPAKVVWIGSATYLPADPEHPTPLVNLLADGFGLARPVSLLTLGPAARLLRTPSHLRQVIGRRQVLTPVLEFVDQEHAIEVSPPRPVRLYHICLSRHAAIMANGIETETYHPGMSALRKVTYEQRNRFLGLFPHITHPTDFGPLAHPRAPEIGEEIFESLNVA